MERDGPGRRALEAELTPGLLFDAVLAVSLPIVAWLSLGARDLFQAVVLYVAFGLLVALVWARLDAPDVALVEAAVGAGITGALLLGTLAWLPAEAHPPSGGVRALLGLAGAAAIVGLGAAARDLPPRSPGLGPAVRARIEGGEVPQPVTAVLLDLRAHDTLLEVAVLLGAAVAAATLARSPRAARPRAAAPLLDALVDVGAPVVIVVAGYLLWSGSKAPGGAFQAAATLAAGGVLLVLARRIRLPSARAPLARMALALGPLVFVGLAALTLREGELLAWPAGRAGEAIVVIEIVLLPSLALILLLFLPPPRDDPEGA